jgi:TraY domain
MATKRKRRGRPPGRNKSAIFSTRITPETRAMLEAAAEASGKSLSQEIENRLKESFRSASKCSGLNEQPDHIQGLAALLATLAGKIEEESGLSWKADEGTRAAISAGFDTLLYGITGSREDLQHRNDALMREANERFEATSDPEIIFAKRFGIFHALHLLFATQSGRPPETETGDHAVSARLAWVQQKLGIGGRRVGWEDLTRQARALVEKSYPKLAEQMKGVDPSNEEKKS